jgi:hypothetical protein
MFRFSIRELLTLTLAAGLAVGWWLEHRKLAPVQARYDRLAESAERAAAELRREGFGATIKEDTMSINSYYSDAGSAPWNQPYGPPSISGTVRYEGRPATGCAIVFDPEDRSSQSSIAFSDLSGQYRLAAGRDNGQFTAGRYSVRLFRPGMKYQFYYPPKQLPYQYNDPRHPRFHVEVSVSEATKMDFDLVENVPPTE